LTSTAQENEIAIIRMAKLASNIYYYERPLQVHNKTISSRINQIFIKKGFENVFESIQSRTWVSEMKWFLNFKNSNFERRKTLQAQ